MRGSGVRTVELTERACEICGAAELEPLWQHEQVTETRDGPWRFPVAVALCRRCALVLASPAPAQQELDAYYAATFAAVRGQALDFSVDARLELLSRYADTGGRLVEIGGNESGPFADRSAELFAERVSIEPNQAVDSDFGSIAELEPASADLVAHYFVLEHVTEARDFLRACHEALREGGTMVCEVPDISLYPRDASALLWHEHVNHFSPATLARLAQTVGFTLERVDHARCSRPFGFAAVFAKGEPGEDEPAAAAEVEHARSCVEAGRTLIESWWADIDAVQHQIEAATKPVVVWAANDVMATLLSRNDLHTRAELTLVDADPAKTAILGDLPVLRPDAAASALASAELLVVCTPLHAKQILEQTRELVGGELHARTAILGSPLR
jgi:SAM-dependent methyltransferase